MTDHDDDRTAGNGGDDLAKRLRAWRWGHRHHDPSLDAPARVIRPATAQHPQTASSAPRPSTFESPSGTRVGAVSFEQHDLRTEGRGASEDRSDIVRVPDALEPHGQARAGRQSRHWRDGARSPIARQPRWTLKPVIPFITACGTR
jgi:hypothetical protein